MAAAIRKIIGTVSSVVLLAFILGLAMGRPTPADDAIPQLDPAADTVSDRMAANLLKHEAIEREACIKGGRGVADNEHCDVNIAISEQLKRMNWCAPDYLSAQPYQQQWRKCSSTITNQLNAMDADCVNAIDETSPLQAAKMCRHLAEQVESMCRDADAPKRLCWDIKVNMYETAGLYEAQVHTP
jgi:hypothetical protein